MRLRRRRPRTGRRTRTRRASTLRSIHPAPCRSRSLRARRAPRRLTPMCGRRSCSMSSARRSTKRGQLLVHGWAVSLTAMVAVQVFLDEVRIGGAQLGGQRDDVGTAFPAYPNARLSGFTLSQRIDETPSDLSAVRVQAISLNGFLHEARAAGGARRRAGGGARGGATGRRCRRPYRPCCSSRPIAW